MKKLIKKKITVLIPEARELEFDRIIEGFEDVYLEVVRQETENGGGGGIILKKKLFLSLFSSKVSIIQ